MVTQITLGGNHFSVANLKSHAGANFAFMSVYTLESFITPEITQTLILERPAIMPV
jgi:hypothetical protein